MAVFCSSLTSCFPGMLLTYFLSDFEIVPVAPPITGITFGFTLHMCLLLLLLLLLKEDLQIMWHKVRLLQISEREKLPRLKTDSKLIKLQEEINGVIEELLEEGEMNITDINNLIYAAATIMTQTLNEPNKRSNNGRDVKFWKIRMQKQISSWRKELSIIAETGTGSDNVKLNRKKRKIFQKYRVTNAREIAQMTETLKQKLQAKAQRI